MADRQFPLLTQRVVLPAQSSKQVQAPTPKPPITTPVRPTQTAPSPGTQTPARPTQPAPNASVVPSAKPKEEAGNNNYVQVGEVQKQPASVTTSAVITETELPVATLKAAPRYAEKVLNFLAWFIMLYVAIVIAVSVYMVISTNARISNLYNDQLFAEAATMYSSAYSATSDVLTNLTGSIFGATMAELIILMAKRILKDEDGLTTVKKFFSKKAVSSDGDAEADTESSAG